MKKKISRNLYFFDKKIQFSFEFLENFTEIFKQTLTWAQIRLFILMILWHVFIQLRFPSKLNIAVLARQSLCNLSTVRFHVRPETLLARKCLLTNVADFLVFGSFTVLRLDVFL